MHLYGRPAFSTARLARRLDAIRLANPRVSAVSARYLHLVEGEVASPTTLDALLDYGPREEAPSVEGARRFVVPRLGTRSPWSSKATDIARLAGLEGLERLERGVAWSFAGTIDDEAALRAQIHDRMTETILDREEELSSVFARHVPRAAARIPLLARGREALVEADRALNLALSPEELAHLEAAYRAEGRDPSDVELMMFAQANSEHCRHKIFNSSFVLDGELQPDTPFALIRRSTRESPGGVLSAYEDNAAVIAGHTSARLTRDARTAEYRFDAEPAHLAIKVETHNHPTAISPFAGAATGAGGEIRDEGATGVGARPKAGMVGFTTSHLRVPGLSRPWEGPESRPARIASPLDIMLEGPLGGAAFGNEFGRPSLVGYFRTFELEHAGERRGYHKPIMIAGGYANIRLADVYKRPVRAGAKLVVLGGPAMLIGLGGGAASSVSSGASSEVLDFASVQRDNAEMERRCQEVIEACVALGEESPILSIHDVGAGGLSNALPELVHAAGLGARFDLRAIPSDEPGMSPLELWCNEAQERYVLAVDPARLSALEAACRRERCPFAVVGEATADARLVLEDPTLGERPIDLPLSVVLGKTPRNVRSASRRPRPGAPLDLGAISLADAISRVLRFPAVADKSFLVTIADRTVGGLVARDPLVGRWQVPVADLGATCAGFRGFEGEAMAIGERSPVALLDAAASARLAVGEALTNLMAAPLGALSDVKLSANWMAAAGHGDEDARLYDAVRAVGAELCPALGLAIPVGKDSLSMKTTWAGGQVASPLSLVVTAFAPIGDVRELLTPELSGEADTRLVLADLGRDRLGGSVLAQVYGALGDVPPDLDDPALFRRYFEALTELRPRLLAYHDRSDGGLLACALEMAFAGGRGVELEAPSLAALFSEELGALLEVRTADEAAVLARLGAAGVHARVVGRPRDDDRVIVSAGERFESDRFALRGLWSELTHALQRLRDDARAADEEAAARLDPTNTGLFAAPSFELDAPAPSFGARPRVAILREQGVNGQHEMAAAFDRAGFQPVDLHMSELTDGSRTLEGFVGLVACGGFSYGDVLGAGGGWAKTALFAPRAKDALARFFARSDTFSLGVCNGCQMMAQLAPLIPGARGWPRWVRNASERFEARLAMVEILDSPSIFFRGMVGSKLPIVVSHGEGRAELDGPIDPSLVPMRFVGPDGLPTQRFPWNPNGSPGGVTAVTSADGRATILMPHPERAFRAVQLSWRPRAWRDAGPFLKMFQNARAWVA